MPEFFKSTIEWKDVQYIATNKEISKTTISLITRKILKGDGKTNTEKIEKCAEFYGSKLAKRIVKIHAAKRIGIANIKNTFTELVETEDFKTLYFFMIYIYGLTFWRTPFNIQRISASSPALRVFLTKFSETFAKKINKMKTEDSTNEKAE